MALACLKVIAVIQFHRCLTGQKLQPERITFQSNHARRRLKRQKAVSIFLSTSERER